MLLLGIDIETSGLDFVNDYITEVGAVIWDTDANGPKMIYNELIFKANPSLSNEIIELTGIEPDDLADYGRPPREVFGKLNDMIRSVNAVVAHNGEEFDKPFLIEEMKKYGMEMADKHWIDTMTNIEYPPRMRTTRLTHLAAEHGFLNPFAHRALFDVLTMLKVLSNYNIYEVIEISREPTYLVQAVCEKPWLDKGKPTQTEIAKEHGFRWEAQEKRWLKKLRKSQLEALQEVANLNLHILDKPAPQKVG